MIQSHPAGRARRGAFTLVELLMVVFILGTLMALLLSAIQSARETGRRTECLNKVRQLALALEKFEKTHNHYPGWQHHPMEATDASTAKPFRYSTSWFPQLLPYLGYEFLFDRTKPFTWKRPLRRGLSTFSYAPSLHKVAVCPSDFSKINTRGAFLSYAVNSGARDVMPTATVPADWPSNGVFLDLWDWRGNPNTRVAVVKMDSNFISKGDGLASTLFLAENRDTSLYYDRNETNNGFVFDWPMPAGFKAINGPGFSAPYEKARPSSHHPGGVNAAFASGAARFLRDDMDYTVYIAIMTPRGDKSRPAGQNGGWSPAIPTPKLSDDF